MGDALLFRDVATWRKRRMREENKFLFLDFFEGGGGSK